MKVSTVLVLSGIAVLEVCHVIKSLYLIAEWLLVEVASYQDAMPAFEWNEHTTVRLDREVASDQKEPTVINQAVVFIAALTETLTTWVTEAQPHDMTFKQLREYAATLGLKGRSHKELLNKVLTA